MLSAIVARLQSHVSILAAVHVSEDIDLLGDAVGQIDDGSAVVVPFREQFAGNTRATGGHLQRGAVQFLVGFVLRHHDDMLGAEKALRFDTYKDAIENALAGWAPGNRYEPCVLVGGEGSPLGDGVSIYLQTWETARFLTGA